jgi:hypothetical protein
MAAPPPRTSASSTISVAPGNMYNLGPAPNRSRPGPQSSATNKKTSVPERNTAQAARPSPPRAETAPATPAEVADEAPAPTPQRCVGLRRTVIAGWRPAGDRGFADACSSRSRAAVVRAGSGRQIRQADDSPTRGRAGECPAGNARGEGGLKIQFVIARPRTGPAGEGLIVRLGKG